MRNSFQISYFKRDNQSQILSRALNLYSCIAIYGLEGVGKTTLLKENLKVAGVTNYWFTLSNFLTLSHLIEKPELNADEVISQIDFLLKKHEVDLFVWDNLHFLSYANQQKLIHTLLHSRSDKRHIFVSDEKIDAPSEIALIQIPSLNEAELHDFLSIYEIHLAADQLQKVLTITAGLPLLIKQWILDPNWNSLDKHILKSIEKKTLDQLKVLATASFDLSKTDLEYLSPQESVDSLLQAALNRSLIEIDSNGTVRMPVFLKNLLSEKITTSEKKQIHKNLHTLIVSKKDLHGVAKLISCLATDQVDEAQAFSEKIALEDIEQLTAENLNALALAFKQMPSDFFLNTNHSKLTRIYIHSLILANRRFQAIELSYSILSSLEIEQHKLNQSMNLSWLIYDMVYWLNRSKYAEQMQAINSKLVKITSKPFSYLFQVEFKFSLSQTGSAASESIRAFSKTIDELIQLNSEDQIVVLALAHAHFQLGILLSRSNKTAENQQAILQFEKSKKLFNKSHRTYFELFCDFNICKIMLYNPQTATDVEMRIESLRRMSQLNGYSYLLSGVNLLAAEASYLNLCSQKALVFIEQAMEKFDSGMPAHAKADILKCKIEVLKDLGRQSEVLNLYGQLVKETGTKYERTAYEAQIHFIEIANFQEAWEAATTQETTYESLQIYLLERGMSLNSEMQTKIEHQSYRLEFAEIQNRIISAVRQNLRETTLELLKEADIFLNRTNEPRIERIAMWCLQTQLDPDKRISLLQHAAEFLEIVPATPSTKAFFKSWIKAIQNAEPIEKASEFSLIQKPELERWSLWLPKSEQKKYTLYSDGTQRDMNHLLEEVPKKGIYLIENQKELYVNGKRNKSLEKKPVLLQIVALLMSHYPEAISKATFASLLWSEVYDPSLHDTRIYASIQRVRAILGPQMIDNWQSGYRFSAKHSFYLLRSNENIGLKQNKIANIFMEYLRQTKKKNANEELQWLGKKALVEAANTSESTAKRVLAILLSEDAIERKGSGSQVFYRSKK